MECAELVASLRARLSLTGTTPDKPHMYHHGTRQLLEQLDYVPKDADGYCVPCRIVPVEEIEAIVKIISQPEEVNE